MPIKIKRRSRWKRVLWLPRTFIGHYEILRKTNGRLRGAYTAWLMAVTILK